MRWLVTGAGGQLGSDLLRVLGEADVVGLARADLDLLDSGAVRSCLAELRPDVVVNAAAYTAVDAAQSDEEAATAVNGTAPGVLAEACAQVGARLVHVSTDYVFDGTAQAPYPEDTPVAPASAYGRSKAAGERAVLAVLPSAWVVRTAWVYGETGGNFVKTMVRLAGERETLSVVDDQVGSPTWSRHLARGLVELGSSGAPGGIYHCTNRGSTTWCGFTRAIFDELGLDPSRVQPTTTEAFPRPAPRPAYSVLGHSAWDAAGLPPLPDWRDALHEAFATVGPAFRGGLTG